MSTPAADKPTLLYNFWYPVARSCKLRKKPLEARLLGHDLVVFRDQAGAAHVLAARCPHRGGNLARGRVIDGCVACPYHQWRYDGSGACVRIPTQAPEVRIPKAARVRSFPVIEQQGLVWTCVGDIDQVPAAPPRFDGLDDPEMHVISVERRVVGPFEWWVENLIDMQHIPFVHWKLYGRQDPILRDISLERYGDELGFAARAVVGQGPSMFGRFTHHLASSFDMGLTVEHIMPGTTHIVFDLGGGKIQDIYFFALPESEDRSRVFQFVGRNYMLIPFADTVAASIAHIVLWEDGWIFRNSLSHLTVNTSHKLVNVGSDGLAVEFVRLMRLWSEREQQLNDQ